MKHIFIWEFRSAKSKPQACSFILQARRLQEPRGIHGLEFPGITDFFVGITRDEISFPEDSITYRWWARYNLYSILLSHDSLIRANDTLRNFMNEYQKSVPIKLEGLAAKIPIGGREFASDADFDYLEQKITTVNVAHRIDSVTKEFYQTYLQYVKDSFNMEGTEDDFFDIANSCVFFNGPSVLDARILLSVHSPELSAYEWNDSVCGYGGGSKTSGSISKRGIPLDIFYRLHPNLLKDRLIAQIRLREEEQGWVEIYTLQGKLLQRTEVFEGNNILDLSNQPLSSGVYFYRVFVNGEFKNSDKLVILQ